MESRSPQIQTLAFLALKTTRLDISAKPAPRIMELAIVSIHRDEFLRSIRDNHRSPPSSQQSSQSLFSQNCSPTVDKEKFVRPRILGKLVQVFNPETEIRHDASKDSGIWPYHLSKYGSFPNFVRNGGLMAHLENLPKPIYFIAHDGFQLNFPVLKSELKRAGQTDLGRDVFYVDSTELYKNMDDLWMKISQDVEKMAEVQSQASSQSQKRPRAPSPQNQSDPSIFYTPSQKIIRYGFRSCDGTPGSDPVISPSAPTPDGTPKSQNPDVCRELFPSSDFPSQSQSSQGETSSKHPYSLDEIYKRIFKDSDPPGRRSAEDDCLCLLQIAAHYGDDFLAEIEKSRKLLSEIKNLED